jgi:hypothetical protein
MSAWRRRLVSNPAPRQGSFSPISRIVVVGVYRHRNSQVLRTLLDQSPEISDVRLWSLDGSDDFPGLTLGEGPGGKFSLINRLVGAAPLPTGSWLVVTDDDVTFTRGDLARFLAYCERAQLDLAQPAHTPASFYTHAFTVARPWSRARLTGFVEIGPLFALSPKGRSLFLPFDESGMGWGMEFRWHEQIARGARLGVVDACHIVHHSPAGSDYGTDAELQRMLEAVHIDSYEAISSLKGTYGTWYRWQPKPALEIKNHVGDRVGPGTRP